MTRINFGKMYSHVNLGDTVAAELERDLLRLIEQSIEANVQQKVQRKARKASSAAESGVGALDANKKVALAVKQSRMREGNLDMQALY